MKKDLVIPPGWQDKLIASHVEFSRDIAQMDPSAFNYSFLDNYDHAYGFLEPFLVGGPKILEMGSGVGTALTNLLLHGFDVSGVEPGKNSGFEGRYDMACEMLKANGVYSPERIVEGVGEDLPFPDNQFDIVFSDAVLEHVQDVRKCVSEAMRVLKPGGKAVFDLPNYQSWFETHYMIPWFPAFPYLPKTMAKWYVRLLGRKDYYIDEMNFVTPHQFRRFAREMGVEARVSLFPFQWLRKIRPIEWVHSRYYVHQHDIYDGRQLNRRQKAQFALLGFPMGIMESLGLCKGFRVTLIKPQNSFQDPPARI
jgi:SAM-dependent methyltransferase